MSGLVSKLKEYGIPMNSAVSAIQHLNGKSELSQEQYESMILDVTDVKIKFPSQREARYAFLYLVQNTIKKAQNTDVLDGEELLAVSIENANHYIKNNSWVFATAEEDENPKVDSNGKPKRKKGAKQEEAARIYNENKSGGKKVIIEKFMTELDMSKAGATTYFYNCKKKFGS